MTLLQFPADRRMADIRRCAEALRNLHGEEANQFWRSEMSKFSAALEAAGAGREEISRQASIFMHAIQSELQLSYAADDLDQRA